MTPAPWVPPLCDSDLARLLRTSVNRTGSLHDVTIIGRQRGETSLGDP